MSKKNKKIKIKVVPVIITFILIIGLIIGSYLFINRKTVKVKVTENTYDLQEYRKDTSYSVKDSSIDSIDNLPEGKRLEGYCLYNLTKQQMVKCKNGDKTLYPASLSKLMTNYILWDYISKGKLKETDHGVISKEVDVIAAKLGGGVVPKVTPNMTLKELSTASLIFSANDATMAIAAKIAGSENEFAKIMEQYAVDVFGFKKGTFHFFTSSGLAYYDFANNGLSLNKEMTSTNPTSQNQFTPQQGLEIFNKLITNFPKTKEIMKIEDFIINNFDYMATWKIWANVVNRNYFIGGKSGAHPTAHPEGGWGFSYAGMYKKQGNDYTMISMDSHTDTDPLKFQSKVMDYIKQRKTEFDFSKYIPKSQINGYSIVASKTKTNVDTTLVNTIGCNVKIAKQSIKKDKADGHAIGSIDIMSGNKVSENIQLVLKKD